MLILHLLKHGDHIITADSLSGATENLLNRVACPVYGMEVEYVDLSNLETLKSAIKENTKCVMFEFPTNPIQRVYDIPKISEICKEFGILVVVDNTLSSPIVCNPLELGADISWHSCTKYISGHSDITMGTLITNNKDLYDRMHEIYILTGPIPSSFDCFMVLRSLKTLNVRMKQISKNALTLSEFLLEQEIVGDVFHTGLDSHPDKAIYDQQTHANSGMVSFDIKNASKEDVREILKALQICTIAGSLGGVKTTVECPSLMSHKKLSSEDLAKAGISESLIRIAVGIEDPADLIADFKQAFKIFETNKASK